MAIDSNDDLEATGKDLELEQQDMDDAADEGHPLLESLARLPFRVTVPRTGQQQQAKSSRAVWPPRMQGPLEGEE